MDNLVAEYIVSLSLALPVALIVAFRAGRMLQGLNALNMEGRVTELTVTALKQKIVDQLGILLQVNRDTTASYYELPPQANVHNIAENLFWIGERGEVHSLNQIYVDLVNQGTQSIPFAKVLEQVLSSIA